MAPDISLRNADARTRLATYLNDHLGGSATGRQLAQRALQANRGNEYGIVLEDVARQIEEDVASLETVMDRLGVKPDRVKEAMGWTFEKFGRLKLNGQLLGYSPLSRLVELEGLMLGITGKWRCGWRSVRSSPATRGSRGPTSITSPSARATSGAPSSACGERPPSRRSARSG